MTIYLPSNSLDWENFILPIGENEDVDMMRASVIVNARVSSIVKYEKNVGHPSLGLRIGICAGALA